MKYFLRTNKRKGTANLSIRISRPKMNVAWWINTGIAVDIESWTKAEKSSKALQAYFATDAGKKVQEKTELVEGVVNEFLNNTITNADKAKLENAIREVVNNEAVKAMEEVEKRKQEAEEKQLHVISQYFDYFFSSLKDGTIRRRDGRKYTESSISIWRTFGQHMKNYLAHTHAEGMTFDEINRSFADGFVVYLENAGLMASTINEQVLCFRRLCNAAAVDEKNASLISIKVWKERAVKDDEKRAEIALTTDEINAIYELPLTGQQEQVRDIWVLGYFTAQRVSDYSVLTRDNFKTTPNGLDVICLKQKKTGKEVVVPILDARVYDIAEKYGYNFPTLSRDAINRQIKKSFHILASTMPTLCAWERTLLSTREREKEQSYIDMTNRIANGEILHGEEAKRYNKMKQYAKEHESGNMLYKRDHTGAVIRQRWELVTCHTSRRTAVTAMYDQSIYDARDIMSVSGHTTLSNFEKYIKRGAVAQDERIAKKSGKVLLKVEKKNA